MREGPKGAIADLRLTVAEIQTGSIRRVLAANQPTQSEKCAQLAETVSEGAK